MTNIESSLSPSAVADLQDREGSLVGKIASEIAGRIVNGDLKPGDDLNSVELATRFGTSRTPVREALMLLEKEGLVEIPPRRRPRVAHVTFQEIEELYQIRALLNGMMIELFVAHADEAGLAEAHAALERMQAAATADETDVFIDERVRLHAVWADRCGNQTLKKTLAAWRARISLRRLGLLQGLVAASEPGPRADPLHDPERPGRHSRNPLERPTAALGRRLDFQSRIRDAFASKCRHI